MRNGGGTIGVIVAALVLLAGAPASAQPLVPDEIDDPELGALAAQYDRQFFTFNARPFGLSLDGFYDPAQEAVIVGFFAQPEPFEVYAGAHPFTVLGGYGEHGDLGMFGGVAAVGDALRYVVLRDGGADAARVAEARAEVIRAMRAIHMFQALTGVPGVVARGVMRLTPDEDDVGAPPVPGCCPATLPLFDAGGNPQPVPKVGVWRDDQSGLYPDWIWMDDVSKDQADGYAAALGALWDAVATDPDIPAGLKADLVEDARALAHKLMTPVSIPLAIGRVNVDMVLLDADGRLPGSYGLNPRVIDEGTPIIVPESFSTRNGFNALLGLSVIKICHHITGDDDIAAFYYDELIGTRTWLDAADAAVGGVRTMYLGTSTNYSNVNMAATALYSLLRYEGDAAVRARLRSILETGFYAPGVARQPRGLKQSFFDLIFAGLRAGGTDATAVADAIETLREFPDPPYLNTAVVNCDDAEIAAGTCTAIDGSTIRLASGTGHGGTVVAQDPVPKRIRPPSDFEWRSDPHDVNGGGGALLCPGGDFRAAYWMGRALRRSPDNEDNVSPLARDRWGGGPDADADGDADADADDDADADADAGADDDGAEVEADVPADEASDAGPETHDDADEADEADGTTSNGGNSGCGCRAGAGTHGGLVAYGVVLTLFAAVALYGRRGRSS
jgi:hypothetical protein